ncbi:MAG: hypothetical protein MUF54_09900, partial [Polyangiaceae bacterium]|nr:hypothetical protein [Polyangiaceae bacterium]
ACSAHASARRSPDEPADCRRAWYYVDGVMVQQDGESASPRGSKTGRPKAPRHETRCDPASTHGSANDDGQDGRSWHDGSVAAIPCFDNDAQRLRTTLLEQSYEATVLVPRAASTCPWWICTLAVPTFVIGVYWGPIYDLVTAACPSRVEPCNHCAPGLCCRAMTLPAQHPASPYALPGRSPVNA